MHPSVFKASHASLSDQCPSPQSESHVKLLLRTNFGLHSEHSPYRYDALYVGQLIQLESLHQKTQTVKTVS